MSATSASPPSITVVVPTYQRREIVVRTVRSIASCRYEGAFEVVVVVDGATDGSAEALKELRTTIPVRVVEQANQGAAAARNAGAQLAQGEVILFLDDDMEAAPDLLEQHAKSMMDGADAVLGHIPLHPRSPPGVLSAGVKAWADHRGARLASPTARLNLFDLLTGQLSVRRELFQRLGGFDAAFTARGSFGNEDLDLGYRLIRENAKIVFNEHAISWQYYAVQPAAYFKQWRQAGEADVRFARKHPEQAAQLFILHHIDAVRTRYLWQPIAALPLLSTLISAALRWCASWLSKHYASRRIASVVLYGSSHLEYWIGVRRAGGVPQPRPLLILCYHAIADLESDPVLSPYGLPASVFSDQIDFLKRFGANFVSPQEVVNYLVDGRGLPRNPVLITFDDCYQNILDIVPVLHDKGVPALAFAVTGLIGKSNEWDRPYGAASLPLLDRDALDELTRQGFEIGSHGKTHCDLGKTAEPSVEEELAGSIRDFESLDLPAPRFVAYPYGEHNESVRRAAARAGFELAFGLGAGRASSVSDRYALPRTEILRRDVGWRFLAKLIWASLR